MSRTYQYININNYYFCLQQNPAVLAWILFLKRDDLRSICKPWHKEETPHGLTQYLRHCYKLFVSNLNILIFFSMYHFNLRNTHSPIELSIYGHICVYVHKGYKVFNLRKDIVTKLFDSDVNKDSITDELERLQLVSRIDFAPTLGKWNIDEKWYEEEYISEFPPSSYKSPDSTTLLKTFSSQIISCLNELILFKKPISEDSLDYVDKIIKKLKDGKLSRQELDVNEVNNIKQFVNSTVEQLQNDGSSQIHLVFSHGDFCPANIMNTRNGIRILDWENAEYRSALFDFYSYFFYLAVCINHPVDKLIPSLNEALSKFVISCSLKPSDISEDFLALQHIYRRIFYIELLCRLEERVGTDNNLDIMDFVRRYIDEFKNYEDIILNGLDRNKTHLQLL